MFTKRRFEVPCTLEVEHSHDSLHAHVELDGDVVVHPGDEVIVHGPELNVPFGTRVVERRTATVVRASQLERRWTELTGDLEFMELLEFSFSSGKKL
ncbi:MAG: hypothetical protein EA356_07720 [Geminicoccaceae bacterium]|nr:MAG: hypothetical protein EA356_07720 [Geminicoccaceae bacterium]